MDERRFKRWLEAYREAWEQGKPDAVVKLFADGAHYHETPFDEPMVGADAIRRYWEEGAEQGQRDVEFSYEIAAVTKRTGFAYWNATFVRVPSGRAVELDGFLRADFDADDHCTVFREWWHRRERKPAQG